MIKCFYLILFVTCITFAQRKEMDPEEGSISYVNDSLFLSQSDIFSRCLDKLTDIYVSTKYAIDVKDREAGIITIASVYPAQKIPFSYSNVRYRLKIQIKDNKIKMSFETGKWLLNDGSDAVSYCYPSKKAVEIMLKHYAELHDGILRKLLEKSNF